MFLAIPIPPLYTLRAAALAIACSMVATHASADEGQHTQVAGREVYVWAPPQADEGKHPIILFSHGMGGCATQSLFLTQALAEHGYWVFAPNHKDAKCINGKATGAPEQSFRDAGKWNDQTYAPRAEDLKAIIASLHKDPNYYNKIDFSSLGLVGHSLGGYTVLGLAGAWPRWTMPEVKAVLALSPYSRPFDLHHTLSNIKAPVMYQGGSFDLAITPFIKRPGGSYDQTPGPKYFVEIDRAGHFAWTNRNEDKHAVITHYALAFLDSYVKGEVEKNKAALKGKEDEINTLYTESAQGVKSTDSGQAGDDSGRDKWRDRFKERWSKRHPELKPQHSNDVLAKPK